MARRKADREPAPAGSPPPSEPPPGEQVSGPEELRITRAMDYYRAALQDGPSLARDVMAEGKRLGHTRRAQERARARLHVKNIPSERWQGPWMIALPDDPAVEEARRRRKEKARKRQQRKGNGRRKKQQGGEGSDPQDAALAATR